MTKPKFKTAPLVKRTTYKSTAATCASAKYGKAAPRRVSPPSPSKAIKVRVPPTQTSARADSKQAKVLAMLQSVDGTTIDAIVEATSWQPHSVRGFLAGVVRKRLKLNLTSVRVGDVRIYRIETAYGPAAAKAA